MSKFVKNTEKQIMGKLFMRMGLIVLMLMHIQLSAQNSEPKALLYKISGNGLQKPSYLYGTMHVSNKIAFNLADSFFIALKSVDMIALEINPDSFMNYSMKYDLNYVSPSDRYTTGSTNFYSDMSATQEIDLDVVKENLSDIDALTNFLLFRHRSVSQNYEEGTYLDLFIFQAGKKLKKKISHVEDYNVTNEMLAKSYQSDPGDDDDDDYFDYDSDSKPISEQVDDAYRNRDIELIDSLDKVTSTKNHYKYFIVERNKNQANALVELMKTQSVFCGVGVAHLGGDSGVVKLLRQKGYTVSPVAQKSSKSSNKTFDKISSMDYPLTFSKFTTVDSLFTVELPAETYTLYTDNATLMHYCPEMVNGAYYQIVRLRTGEAFTGKSETARMSMIDSLLYEGTPGKIIKKTPIPANAGFTGLDVISQTSLGNIIRAQIYVGEQEIIIFKARGVKDYAIQKNGNAFFNSIKFAPVETESFVPYSNNKAGVSLSLPGNRIEHNLITSAARTVTPQALRLEAFDQGGDQHYRFLLSVLHDFSYFEEDTFELEAMVKEFYEELDIENYSKSLTQSGIYPVMEAAGGKAGRYYFIKATLKGSHYALMAFSSSDSIMPRAYFDSFRWIDYQYDGAIVNDEDSILHFKTKNILNEVNLSSRTLYNRSRSKMGFFGFMSTDPTPEEIIIDGINEIETYSSSETPEFVQVSFRRFPKYAEYDSAGEVFINRYYDYYGDMKTKLLYSNKSANIEERIYCYTDTAVSRAIYVKSFLKGGALYTVKAMCDSSTGLTGWTKAFFDNFVPADTTFGSSIFEPKGALFLTDLTSSDSTTKAIAKKADPYLLFEKECETELISFLQSADFKLMDEDEKEDMIDRIGHIQSPELTNLLVNLYMNSGDSVELQHNILSALSGQKTKKSFDAFLTLMEYDTPLAGEYEDFSDIYTSMFDSLDLAKGMFPALLVYTRYPEHQQPIYALLLTLITEKKLDAKIITENYRSILADANDEFKRVKMEGSVDDYGYMDFFEDLGIYSEETTSRDSILLKHHQFEYSSLLEVLMQLLASEHSTNAQVKNFFNKSLKSKQNDLVLMSLMIMDKNKIATPDTLWTSLSRKPDLVLDVYKQLKKKNALHLMDSASMTQLFFATSYFDDIDEDEDSVVFLKKEIDVIKGETGYFYFFKVKSSYNNSWYLAYAGPYPLDGSLIDDPEMIERRGDKVGKKSDGEEEIKDARKTFFYHDRDRAEESGYGFYF